MKNIVTGVVIVGAMLAAGNAAADFGDVKPYVGADYYQAMMKGKSVNIPGIGSYDYKDEAPKSYPGASIYAGIKFIENFGAELGADFFKKKSKTDQFGYKTEIKRSGGHLDLAGFWPLNDRFNLIGSLGVGIIKPKLTETDNQGESISENSSKRIAFARIGAGTSYMFTEMLGLRAKVNWENTNRLKVNLDNTGDVQPFKDTVSFTLGAFAQF